MALRFNYMHLRSELCNYAYSHVMNIIFNPKHEFVSDEMVAFYDKQCGPGILRHYDGFMLIHNCSKPSWYYLMLPCVLWVSWLRCLTITWF